MLVCPRCGARKIVPLSSTVDAACACGGTFDDLLAPAVDHGKVLTAREPPARVREYALEQVRSLDLGEPSRPR
jgi:nicotinate phosphoribosyltransferase